MAITEREVVLSVRADAAGNKRRIRLPGTEFIRRFMRHVLPKGIKRTRHYGLLASASVARKSRSVFRDGSAECHGVPQPPEIVECIKRSAMHRSGCHARMRRNALRPSPCSGQAY